MSFWRLTWALVVNILISMISDMKICCNKNGPNQIDGDLQEFLKAISGETRQGILLAFLNSDQMTVNEISRVVGIGQSTASEHLSQLKRAGIVSSERRGKEVWYYTEKAKILDMIERLKQLIIDCC